MDKAQAAKLRRSNKCVSRQPETQEQTWDTSEREHNNPFTMMPHMTDLKLILPFKKVDGKRYFCSKAGLKQMKIAASGPHALYPRYFAQL